MPKTVASGMTSRDVASAAIRDLEAAHGGNGGHTDGPDGGTWISFSTEEIADAGMFSGAAGMRIS